MTTRTICHRHYSNEDVGLSGARPFRVLTTFGGRRGVNMPPGDDPDADLGGSRLLVYYAVNPAEDMLIEPHTHEFYEIVFIRSSDGAIHLTEQGDHVLNRGDVLVIAPGSSHGYDHWRGLTKTELLLQPQWLSDELKLLWSEEGLIRMLLATALYSLPVSQGVWRVSLDERCMTACELELDLVMKEAASPRPSLAFYNGCFLKTLSMLNRAFMANNQAFTLPLTPKVWTVTARIEDIVQGGSEFDVDSLAEENALSRRQLERVFKAATGVSISDYYQNRRIQHAMRLLSEPKRTIAEVANMLNYYDTAHFIRLFKERTGRTPGAFRGRHGAEEVKGA